MLEKMHETSFNFENWRGGSLINLEIPQREDCILKAKDIIIKYAIGFIEGNKTMCRPKENSMAVMFLKDNDYFWTHLTIKEFKQLFNLNREE